MLVISRSGGLEISRLHASSKLEQTCTVATGRTTSCTLRCNWGDGSTTSTSLIGRPDNSASTSRSEPGPTLAGLATSCNARGAPVETGTGDSTQSLRSIVISSSPTKGGAAADTDNVRFT